MATQAVRWQRMGNHFPDATLERRVAAHASAMPKTVAVRCGDAAMDWGYLDGLADALARRLSDAGLRPGDRIGWLGRNGLVFPVLLVAARRARLVLCGLNWRLSRGELSNQLAVAGCAQIVADDEFHPLLPDGVMIERADDLLDRLDRDRGPSVVPAADAEDYTTLFFTSGTTGDPKGLAYRLDSVEAAVDMPHTLDFSADAVLMIVAPVFHTAGWMWTQYALSAGLTQVVLPAAAPDTMLATVARYGVTHAQWVPALLAAALDLQEASPVDLGRLRMIAYGASPIDPVVLRRALARFGCDFTQVYGLTETIAPISHLPPVAHSAGTSDQSQATGLVNPGVALRITDKDGNALPSGEKGEIRVRMPFVPAQRFPDAGASPSVDAEYEIATGDIGFLDADGFLWVCDRIGDMIISGGENIYPAEVDRVLASLPGVREAAVYSVADDRWGESVRGAVAMRAGEAFDEARLLEECRARLARYKCPRRLSVVDALPRNAAGKILRRALAERCGA